MPSSADATGDGVSAALARAAKAVQDAAGRDAGSQRPPIVLIDGRSGSGKSTLAGMLREAWAGDAHVIALDDLYPGWTGLARGAEAVRTDILVPLSRGEDAHWTRWDWARDAPGDRAAVPGGVPVIIEGSGVLTPASAPLAPVRVWLESPERSRRERALARDGDTYRPYWAQWAAQEARHLDEHDPRALATIVVEVP